MIEINRQPDAVQLRWFAALWLPAACAVIALMLWLRFGLGSAGIVVAALGIVTTALCLASRSTARRVYIGWMYAVYPIGWTVSHVLLVALYFLILTPIGLGMRLLGRDPMTRAFDPAASSYWIARPSSPPAKRYYQQF